jgi:hypothetical protein
MTRFPVCVAPVLAAVLLLSPPVLARDIYVAITGSDTNGGTSTAPYRTIKNAISKAVSNDIIHVRAGIYSESYLTLKSNLTLISEDGLYAAKLASWLGSGSGRGFVCVGVSNVEINGFESYSSWGQGTAGDGLLRIYNTDNIRIRNCLIHDAPYDCDVVKIGGFGTNTTNTLIENCVIYNPAPTAAGSIAECLDAHPVSGLTVRGCWIYHTSTRKGDILIRSNGGSTNVTWENNVFGPVCNNGANRPSTSAGTVDSDTPQVPSVDGMTVRNNLFLACQGEGAFGVVSSRNVRFYNNMIWNYLGTGAAVAFRNTSTAANQGLDFSNNIVHSTNGRPAFLALGAYTPGTFTHDYNLYWQIAAGGLTDVSLEPHSLVGVDPLLSLPSVPVPGTDSWATIVPRFRPLDASLAINAGTNLAAFVANDINASPRPLGEYDIGPYEVRMVGDSNADGHVDVVDLLSLVYTFGLSLGDPGFDPTCDFNADNAVDVVDLLMFVDNFGR